MTFPELIADKQQAAMDDTADPNSQVIKDAFNFGGRAALRQTALLPTGMAVGFLILLLYYKSQGGYKVIKLDKASCPAGEEDLPNE